MKNTFKVEFMIPIFIFSFCFIANVCAQEKYNTAYRIGGIPNISRFETMTEREVRMDTLMEKHHTESLQRMIDGTAFIEGISEKDKDDAIAYNKIKYQRYKNNRSRYYMDLYVNSIKDNEFINGEDTITTECSCFLSGDTIKVNMGIWVFGGFTFSIAISKDNFNSTYWEDMHEQPVYKADLNNQTLVDNVLVENEEQSLILENKPKFELGENILGHLTFRTKNYYRKSNYNSMGAEDDKSGKNMDTLNMSGSLYFKCILRKKVYDDE